MLIADSSSLILLAKIGIIDIAIAKIRKKLAIPEQVYAECTAKKELFDAQIIEERTKHGSIERKSILNAGLCERILKDFNLGKGEAEAITLCMESKAGLMTDDKKAINACKVLKIRFVTVPRLVAEFYKKEYITKNQIEPIIDKLQNIGRYSNEIIQRMKEDLK